MARRPKGWLIEETRIEFVMSRDTNAPKAFGMSGVNALLSLRLIVTRSVVTRSVVTLGVMVVVAGSDIPRLVATLVGVIWAAVFGVISVIPGFAAIAAGEPHSCQHH